MTAAVRVLQPTTSDVVTPSPRLALTLPDRPTLADGACPLVVSARRDGTPRSHSPRITDRQKIGRPFGAATVRGSLSPCTWKKRPPGVSTYTSLATVLQIACVLT